MKKLDEEFGPLEWRLPEAHAIYWAAQGLEDARKHPNKVNPDDLIQLRRVIYQSMQLSFQRGRLEPNPLSDFPVFGPNLDIIPGDKHTEKVKRHIILSDFRETILSDQLQRSGYQVVLLDMQMPEMDGEETLQAIKNDPVTQPAKVIILTTFDRDDYVFQGVRAGAMGPSAVSSWRIAMLR